MRVTPFLPQRQPSLPDGKGMKRLFPVLSTNISKSNPARGPGLDTGRMLDGGGQPHKGMVPGSVLFTAGLHPVLSPTTRHVPGTHNLMGRTAKPNLCSRRFTFWELWLSGGQVL